MVHLEKVSKHYGTGFNKIKALDHIDLRVETGELVVIRGPSGSGKTTLLLTIGGMLRPTNGIVSVNGDDIYALNEKDRTKFRANNIGFVFQMFHLLPYLNCLENVLLPINIGNKIAKRSQAMELLNRLRLTDRVHHKPAELSAGERQRTAIVRALLNKPNIILADEPTGNLDPENAAEVIGYLSEYHRDGGTVIIVTHGKMADQYADWIVNLKAGKIENIS